MNQPPLLPSIDSKAAAPARDAGPAESGSGRAAAKPEAKPEAMPEAMIDAKAPRVKARVVPDEARPAASGTAAAHPAHGISLIRTTLLGVALVVGAIAAALPAVLLSWLTFAGLVEGATSALLQHTGGLEPTTFGGGFWLSLGVNTGIVLWSVVRRLRGRPAPWRPVVVLIATYVVALWLVVSTDACRLVDVPDVLTAFTLLGADILVQYLLPVALLGLLVQGTAYLWRKGRTGVVVASRITAVAGCLGMAGVTAAGMLMVAGHAASLVAIGDRLAEVRAADLGVTSARQRYERVAGNAGARGTQLCR